MNFIYVIIGLIIYGFIELIAHRIFEWLRNFRFEKEKSEIIEAKEDRIPPALMGRIERACLLVCILCKVPFIIPVFISMKIATQLSSDDRKKPNDYFFIGNIISIALAVITSVLIPYFFEMVELKNIY